MKLFEPISIGKMELKNRIVMPGLASFLIEDDGSYSDKTIEHYRLRAAGGPAGCRTDSHVRAFRPSTRWSSGCSVIETSSYRR